MDGGCVEDCEKDSLHKREVQKAMILDLGLSPMCFGDTRLGCDDGSRSLLVRFSLHLEGRAPSSNAVLLFEVEGFSGKPSPPIGLLGGWSSSLIFSFSKDEGFPLGRNKSVVPWREQDMGLIVEGKDDVYKP